MNIKVKGNQVLSGEIVPSGSKNSAVSLICSSILFDRPVIFENVPDITDVARLVEILKGMGSRVDWEKDKNVLIIDNGKLDFDRVGKKELGNMRGTSLLWGPMLARFNRVNFEELPGGCTLGVRPVSPHYNAFRDFGVIVEETARGVKMNASSAFSRDVLLSEMSPTVTENVLMLATSLKGKSRIVGAASEPQVQDLCNFLVASGAKISGIGSSVLEIEGGRSLKPKTHKLYPDHYEIATFLALAAITGGDIKIKNAMPQILKPILSTFSKFGIEVVSDSENVMIEKGQKINIGGNGSRGTLFVKAQPWPALPVDTLPLFIPIALAAERGQVLFHNWMYESGLFWTSELTKLGANVIMADPHRVIVSAGNKLFGATLEAPYIIRAVVAMVMAAMIAEGESLILNADALYRGHPHFAENLRKLGAKIKEAV